jgi:hypothetical protein
MYLAFIVPLTVEEDCKSISSNKSSQYFQSLPARRPGGYGGLQRADMWSVEVTARLSRARKNKLSAGM